MTDGATPPVTIGVLGSIAPTDADASRLAAVLRHELGRRLGTAVLDLRTTVPQGRHVSPDWRTVRPGWADGCAAVVAAPDVADRVPSPIVCESLAGTLPLAALFDEQVDDLALAVRERIRDQRRRLLGDVAGDDASDPVGRQLDVGDVDALGRDARDELHLELDRVADAVRRRVADVPSLRPGASLDALRRAYADERRRAESLAELLRQQATENEILRSRLGGADGS